MSFNKPFRHDLDPSEFSLKTIIFVGGENSGFRWQSMERNRFEMIFCKSWACDSVVLHLPTGPNALGSILRNDKTKKQTNNNNSNNNNNKNSLKRFYKSSILKD